jgi:hypothetical protein
MVSSWSNGGTMGTARYAIMGSAGTQTAGFSFWWYSTYLTMSNRRI